MSKVTVGLILLLIIGLAGAFFYISKLRKAREDRIRQLETVSSQVSSLKSNLESVEERAEREAQQLRQEKKSTGEQLEQEKKARKAEVTRIEAERQAENAKRDALEKMKNAKIAELTEKQKRQEAEIAKTDERRKAALKEADEARLKAKAARKEADVAISQARKSKSLADNAKRVADARARQAGIQIKSARSETAKAKRAQQEAKTTVSRAQREVKAAAMRANTAVQATNVKRSFENAAQYNAVPGYFKSGYKFAGNQMKVTDPNVCRMIAQRKKVSVWGHRNGLHPNKNYKNSCFFYSAGPKYGGDGNDKIHMIGCAFGGNPKTGCNKVQGKKQAVPMKKPTNVGRYVRVIRYKNMSDHFLNIAEVEVYGRGKNFALGKKVTASSLYPGFPPSNIVNRNLNDFAHTQNGKIEWFLIDLGAEYPIERVNIYNRRDCCKQRLRNVKIQISKYPDMRNPLQSDLIPSGLARDGIDLIYWQPLRGPKVQGETQAAPIMKAKLLQVAQAAPRLKANNLFQVARATPKSVRVRSALKRLRRF